MKTIIMQNMVAHAQNLCFFIVVLLYGMERINVCQKGAFPGKHMNQRTSVSHRRPLLAEILYYTFRQKSI